MVDAVNCERADLRMLNCFLEMTEKYGAQIKRLTQEVSQLDREYKKRLADDQKNYKQRYGWIKRRLVQMPDSAKSEPTVLIERLMDGGKKLESDVTTIGRWRDQSQSLIKEQASTSEELEALLDKLQYSKQKLDSYPTQLEIIQKIEHFPSLSLERREEYLAQLKEALSITSVPEIDQSDIAVLYQKGLASELEQETEELRMQEPYLQQEYTSVEARLTEISTRGQQFGQSLEPFFKRVFEDFLAVKSGLTTYRSGVPVRDLKIEDSENNLELIQEARDNLNYSIDAGVEVKLLK